MVVNISAILLEIISMSPRFKENLMCCIWSIVGGILISVLLMYAVVGYTVIHGG